MTPQQKMQEKLEGCGLPYKRVHCYGSQIMVTSWSKDAAERWATLLGRFAKVRGVHQTLDYNVENRNTIMRPTTHTVWRTWATI